MVPNKMPVEYTITATDYRPRYLSNDGDVYAFSIASPSDLYKSSDWGVSWTLVHSFAGTINQVGESRDCLVVAVEGGKVFYSTDNGVTFVEGLQMSQGISFRDCGFSIYDNIVLVGSYGSGITPEVYLSNDGGINWQTINQFPEKYTHVHDVKFDPYEHLIWVTLGDGGADDKIYWSDDFGLNWQTSEQKMRITQVIPLPDCVLFCSDEYEEQSVYKHTRPERGTWGTTVNPEKLFYPKKDFPGNQMTWATNSAITYGQGGKGFFGFRQGPDNVRVPSVVWGTDGIRITPYWIENKLPTATNNISVGVMGVWGPDKEGNLLVDLITSIDGHENHVLKLTKATQ